MFDYQKINLKQAVDYPKYKQKRVEVFAFEEFATNEQIEILKKLKENRIKKLKISFKNNFSLSLDVIGFINKEFHVAVFSFFVTNSNEFPAATETCASIPNWHAKIIVFNFVQSADLKELDNLISSLENIDKITLVFEEKTANDEEFLRKLIDKALDRKIWLEVQGLGLEVLPEKYKLHNVEYQKKLYNEV